MLFTGSELRIIGLTVAAVVAAAVTYYGHIGGTVAPFVLAGIALALLASLVGRSVEAMGERLGAGATGVVQSALGNLPELFVVLFALKSKLYEVATATIVGSILANVLLVLGLAFVAGGARNGVQLFNQAAARRMALMMLLSVAALVVPALTALLHTPAAGHERALSVAVSILLLLLFIGSLPVSIKKTQAETSARQEAGHAAHREEHGWPLWLALTMLAVTGVAAAFVSDWFVAGLTPAMSALHISQAFAGLVIVAIAGNAVENTTALVLAAKGQSDLAISVVKNSVAQIAVFLFPALILVSLLLTHSLTFVLPPVYIAALALAALSIWQITGDGEARDYEGAALVVLFVIVGAVAWFE